MKKAILIFSAIVMIAGLSTKTMAQATQTTSAGAKIVKALTISEVVASAGLHFGTMTVPSTAATVILAPAGTVSIGTGTITLLAQAPTAHAASYNVTGDNLATYTITLPSANVTLTSGANTMTVNTFTCSYGTNASTFSASGTDSFTVGAKLNLASGQVAGTYSGSFDVTVAYN